MGAQLGFGCTYICEDNFENIMTKFDDFQTYVYETLNASFVDVKDDLDDIFDDASAMLVAKVHQKAASLSHHAAKLDATHRVLQDLLTAADDDEARGLVVLDEDGNEVELVEESVSEVVRHKENGVAWATFAAQATVAFVAGLVVESYRLRKERALASN
jgi:signal-transduction protein with cAMP-binding, CBS, and nucleotidyltransferase domain